MRGIRLGIINGVLERVGLVLVVAIPDGESGSTPIRFWIERRRSYAARVDAHDGDVHGEGETHERR